MNINKASTGINLYNFNFLKTWFINKKDTCPLTSVFLDRIFKNVESKIK